MMNEKKMKSSPFAKLSGLQSLSNLNQKISTSGIDVLKKVPIEDVISVEQVRKKFSDLEELAESIKQVGLQVPINVTKKNKDGKYVIIQGERRWRACKLAGLETIDVIVRNNPKDDPERMIMQLTENLQRSDMEFFEIGEAIAGLVATGLKNRAIAQRLGKSDTFVSRVLQVANARPEIKDLCRGAHIVDLISITNVIKMDEKDPEKTARLIKEAAEQGKTFTRTFVNTLYDEVMNPDSAKAEKPKEVSAQKEQPAKKKESHQKTTNSQTGTKEKATVSSPYIIPEGVKPVGNVEYVSKVSFMNPETGEESVGYLSPDFVCDTDFRVCVIYQKQLITVLVQNLLYLGQVPRSEFEQ